MTYQRDLYETWNNVTPEPHPWDRFTTACGGATWNRIHNMGQIRHRDGGVCTCTRIVKYINPPNVVCNKEHANEQKGPLHATKLAQGMSRPMYTPKLTRWPAYTGLVVSFVGIVWWWFQ